MTKCFLENTNVNANLYSKEVPLFLAILNEEIQMIELV